MEENPIIEEIEFIKLLVRPLVSNQVVLKILIIIITFSLIIIQR